MQNKILRALKRRPLRTCMLILTICIISACAAQRSDIMYAYFFDANEDFVSVIVSDHKKDVIQKLVIRKHYNTSSLMDEQNMTLQEAETHLQQQFEKKQMLVQEWGTDAFLCEDCDVIEAGKEGVFASIHMTPIEQVQNTPHLGFWETIHFDFTKQSHFSMNNTTMQAIMEEYQLTSAYVEKGNIVSMQALLDSEPFPLHEFMQFSSIYQKLEDGETTEIRTMQPIPAKQREISHYAFMDVPWFAANYHGLEFQSADGYDNVVVPWNYCINGSYQEQRTGYWSACAKVSLRVYEMFGEYANYLPVSETLTYEVSEGYRLAEGIISNTKWETLIDQAEEGIEIPTPFDLNTFWIGHGFKAITVSEVKTDGSVWEYVITKADDSGFYLEIYSKENDQSDQIKHSFTFFAGEGFDAMYQELKENGVPTF